MQQNTNDTIVAISTPIGESAIGVVRMSGSESLKIADTIFKGRDGLPPSRFKSHTVRYGWIINGALRTKKRNIIDEALITVMRAPKTYTREDIVEVSCHGGAMALRKILERIVQCGVRLAEPGEFTKRAFLNGRIDLSKAEAVLDIIRAKTDAALKLGIEQLSGTLSEAMKAIRRELITVLSHIEADIDFSEEEIATNTKKLLHTAVDNACHKLEAIIDDSQKASFFREGIKVVICGRTNVGKSSLLNALLKKERAIVTHLAGTTRDVIEECITLKGVGIRLIDTAGFGRPKNCIDHHAIRLSKNSVAISDIILLVFDGNKPLTRQDRKLIGELKGRDAIAVINKTDLPQRIEKEYIRRHFKKLISVSCYSQHNIKLLEDSIIDFVYKGKVTASDGLITANARQLQEIRKAYTALDNAGKSAAERRPLECIALDIKQAIDCIGRVTGETIDDVVLDTIFSKFCIGK